MLEDFIKANHEDVAFPLGKVAILRIREDVGRILDGLLKIGEEGSTVEWKLGEIQNQLIYSEEAD